MKEIQNHTEKEFKKLVEDICSANTRNELEHIALVRLFCRLTQHPDGSDLIYYPDDEADASPERISRPCKNAVFRQPTIHRSRSAHPARPELTIK
ncbi:bacteriocin immunity protein [Marinobacter halodurans]|uniref:Bacteriocin immunity protein n=2 Tax=Marinobacter halodurans TaxID=2528979 RepID=A0ABY1ZD38_9GAMM|nr:bacteriocin immunity protein [Marinobacter halodurans]